MADIPESVKQETRFGTYPFPGINWRHINHIAQIEKSDTEPQIAAKIEKCEDEILTLISGYYKQLRDDTGEEMTIIKAGFGWMMKNRVTVPSTHRAKDIAMGSKDDLAGMGGEVVHIDCTFALVPSRLLSIFPPFVPLN